MQSRYFSSFFFDLDPSNRSCGWRVSAVEFNTRWFYGVIFDIFKICQQTLDGHVLRMLFVVTNYIKIFNSEPEIISQFDIKSRRCFVSYAKNI